MNGVETTDKQPTGGLACAQTDNKNLTELKEKGQRLNSLTRKDRCKPLIPVSYKKYIRFYKMMGEYIYNRTEGEGKGEKKGGTRWLFKGPLVLVSHKHAQRTNGVDGWGSDQIAAKEPGHSPALSGLKAC